MSTQELDQPMGQCSVTGKMVPEDELVTIQGQRVCAEGKAILLERLKAGEGLPGEKDRPTVIRRFGCIFLDGLIVGVPFAIITMVLGGAKGSPALVGLVSLISVIVQVVYFGQLHARNGQTVGKMAGKLRVVNLDGTPVSLKTAYIRAVAYAGFGVISAVATLTGVMGLVAVGGVIVGCWGLANVLFALFDRAQQRALHDRIAGTRVIQLV